MRTLQVYRDHFNILPGGIERHVHELAHGLRPEVETEVLVAARARSSSTHMDGDVPVHLSAELGRFQGVPFCPRFQSVMSAGNYDVIHLHSPNPTGEIASRLARTNAARVATYHATSDRAAKVPLYHSLLYSTMRSCARVLASSERLIEATPLLRRLRDERPAAIRVVPFGVDLDRFHPGETEGSRHFRERWGPGPIVLFLGRLRYYKGLEHLIRALTPLDAKFVMIGEGLERGRVENLARSLLGERFVYHPVMTDPEIADAYRAADLFCLPSTSSAEAFGLAAVEAMASGLPVITTEVGTATSVVNQDSDTGLVVPPRDERALRGAISTLLGDKETARQMGKAARVRAEENYDRRVMFERITAIYREAARECRDRR